VKFIVSPLTQSRCGGSSNSGLVVQLLVNHGNSG
jgi:hypothetical protein